MLEFLGIIGGIIIISSFVPQIIKLLKTKSSKDISVFFVFCVAFGTFCLAGYSIYIEDKIFAIINLVTGFLAGIMLVLSIIYSKNADKKAKTEGLRGS